MWCVLWVSSDGLPPFPVAFGPVPDPKTAKLEFMEEWREPCDVTIIGRYATYEEAEARAHWITCLIYLSEISKN